MLLRWGITEHLFSITNPSSIPALGVLTKASQPQFWVSSFITGLSKLTVWFR